MQSLLTQGAPAPAVESDDRSENADCSDVPKAAIPPIGKNAHEGSAGDGPNAPDNVVEMESVSAAADGCQANGLGQVTLASSR